MFFTNFGRTYRLKGYEIPESSRQSKGMNVVNLLPLEAGEKISAMIKVPDFGEDKYYLCMVTRKGVIKRTKLDEYRNIRKGGIIAINLDEGDELAWVKLTSGDDDIYVATRGGKGSTNYKTDKYGKVVSVSLVNDKDDVILISSDGIVIRIPANQININSRTSKGVRVMRVSEGETVVSAAPIANEDEMSETKTTETQNQDEA